MSTTPELDADGVAAAERELCGLVNALAQRIDSHVRLRATPLGLSAPQAVALRELTGPMTMRELAERMSCEPSNATFVVDRLERSGYVRRRPHPTDRRAKLLVLTPEGTALREQLLTQLAADSPLQPLSQRELHTLQRLLERAVTGD
ncbi:MarR family winged helix-turn-helix transcriptional regulator [Nocardia sp. NPDC050406]|uniref:MarR family winged helix-turn-helix transcriptional regulator n=1 Tax=Nocardia sp. NPDC050406 TaxID=3364318 RepID=UPI0037963874